jgi:hypothetical protein
MWPIQSSLLVRTLTLQSGSLLRSKWDRVIAQPVSRRLSAAVALFRSQVRSCGICGGQSGAVGGFFRVLRFPLPILIPPNAPYSYHLGTVQ